MAKKTLSLVLACFMLVSVLAGCGGSSTAETEQPQDNPTAESAASQPPANEPAENNSGSEAGGGIALGNGKDIYNEEIKIGHVAMSTMGITNVLIEKALFEQISLYNNVTVTRFDCMYDVNTQMSTIEECVTQGYDAILVECLDTEALNNAIVAAEEAGVVVITVNSGASALHTLHLQGSDYESGWIAGEYLVEKSGGTGNALILDCPAEQKARALMSQGFEEYVTQNSDIVVLENQSIANWSQEIANTTMRDLLTKYDDVQMVYCASDDIALGAVQAIEASGRSGDGILVWGNCAFLPALQAIKEGTMYGSCFSDVYLQYSLALYFALMYISTGHTSITAGYTETPEIDQAMFPVTAENVDEIMQVSRWLSSSN